MKRILTVLAIVMVGISIVWVATISPQSDEKLIGIIQYVHHPLLDETHRGLVHELSELGYTKDNGVIVETRIADKSTQLCSQITRQYVDQNALVIVAIATPAAQAVNSMKGDVPMIFAAITDPVAAGLVKTLEQPGGNATGTSNRWPFEKQIHLIHQILPDAKKIGAIWNPGEVNSDAAMKYIRPLLEQNNLKLVENPVSSTADVAPAARSIADQVDAFLMIPDNTVLAATATLVEIARATGTPLIGGDINTVEQGSLASFGYDYFELGQVTARMIDAIVSGTKTANEMPVQFPPNASLALNKKAFDSFGLTPPPELLSSAIHYFD